MEKNDLELFDNETLRNFAYEIAYEIDMLMDRLGFPQARFQSTLDTIRNYSRPKLIHYVFRGRKHLTYPRKQFIKLEIKKEKSSEKNSTETKLLKGI